MALPIKIARRASAEIERASAWWDANRPKAPGALKEELQRALDLIAHQPGVGSKATNPKLTDVRRIHLSRIRYYLYYRLSQSPEQIEVLALWHSSRGQEPEL